MTALFLAGCGPAPIARSDKGAEWLQWSRSVEAHYPVSDAEGHGSDIGSDEWAMALSRKLGVIDADGHGPDIGSAEWRAAVESKIGD